MNQQQQNQRLRMDSNLGNRGLKRILLTLNHRRLLYYC